MTNLAYNRTKGAAYETDLVKYLRTFPGTDVEQLHLRGVKDEGDLVLKIGGLAYILEAKNDKSMDLSGWVREAETEAGNYATARGIEPVHFSVVSKRRQKPVSESYVVTPLWEWVRQIDQLPF